MTRFRSTLVLLILLLSYGGVIKSFASAESEVIQTNHPVQTAIQTAETLQATTRSLGFEWTTIEPLLASAKRLRDQGKLGDALDAASEAILHGRLAIQQAKHAERNWHLETP